MNFLKSGISFADLVNTVSPQYAKEIKSKRYGCGLEKILRSKRTGVRGILNGIDTKVWNPNTDSYLKKKYGIKNFEKGKEINKRYLQKQLKLPLWNDVPVFGLV